MVSRGSSIDHPVRLDVVVNVSADVVVLIAAELLAVGVSPLQATVTNPVAAVACWPGSALTSRRELVAARDRVSRQRWFTTLQSASPSPASTAAVKASRAAARNGCASGPAILAA